MTTSHVPIIDVTDLQSAEMHRAVDAACREWGFFYIVGHGIPAPLRSALRQQMQLFFAQPLAEKQAISRSAANPWGFYDRELTKHTPDWKQIYDYGPSDGVIAPQWPRALPGFKAAICAYYDACAELSLRLLRVISANLGMPAHALDGYFQPAHTSFLRVNYYPKCPKPARPHDLSLSESNHLGINHHTDAGAVTLLAQDDQPGLEVFREGTWHLIEPRRDTLVVNIGDIVQVWSNDRYCAPLHRVLVSERTERFSVPFFFNPAYSVNYEPLPTTIDAGHPARYRAINWGEFRAGRAAGDYATRNEYTQISLYRI
jgi:isopenicillin N synthase-like dioxygenase